MFTRAVTGVAGELGILGRERDGRRLRILRTGNLEESIRESRLWPWPGRQHREIFRIFELGVCVERKQADECFPLLHDHRDSWRDHVGGVAAEHEIDLVNIE